jgi:DNA-binding transcriptional regulator YiaG
MMTTYSIPGSRSALISASHDRKHRPLSHPLIASRPVLDERSYYAHIAGRIRLLRAASGLSQRALGARLGVSNVTICHWEHEEQRPTAWHVDRLERVLGEVRP